MRTQTLLLLSFLWLLLMETGCRGDEPKRMPDTIPDVHGYISSIKKTTEQSDKSKAIIMVSAIDGIEVKYPQANIKIDKNTLIKSTTGEHLKLEQLREGHEIEAWFENEVIESTPPQGYVKAIQVKTN